MKVETTPYVQSLIDAKKAVDAKSEEFSAELDRQLMNVLKHQEMNKTEETSQENAGVKTFKDELTSMGALAFMQHFNMEKIEKLLEEKRKELEAMLGLDEKTTPPLEGQARTQALDALEEMLSAYTEELKEQMSAKKELEKGPLSSLLST